MNKLPFILVLGVDNTIIGNYRNCVIEYNVIERIFKECIHENNTLPTKCQNIIIDLQDELCSGGLLRPYMKEFMTFCYHKFTNLEVFLYSHTASWISPQIEKALKIKVNKTILTDRDTLFADIKKALDKRYPLFRNETHAQKVFTQQTLFIDCNGTHPRQIICPKYSFEVYYNIPTKIVAKYNLPLNCFDRKDILEYIESRNIPIYNPNGSIYQQNKNHYMLEYLLLSKSTELSNSELKPDTFFLDMIAAFEKVTIFTDKALENINKSISVSV